ncbi:TonB-dependent receptor [Phenylobacterium deserti]|uniref:TonB-dependent receptor n=1 Tax=Phenylobacterium deserti TaxID=1914756 RepID=A0A328AAH6_9CAUL|nr:TonB-dependent receptor [Phenylobacterium deserti]RAK51559.1 TonB-dependent receptor [Phenylobacterium deserti]
MQSGSWSGRRAWLWCGSALAVFLATQAYAADVPAAADAPPEPTGVAEVVVTAVNETRSTVAMESEQIQRVLPGASPLKAIQFLPGVIYRTADPWGNNEQNLSLFVHGFSTQQLGYTLDGVPLGDQQYGNYNGLSVSRAISSENVARVSLSSGAGSLGVASTSNLGGAIETFSREPSAEQNLNLRQTLGSYEANRTFARVDTGQLAGGWRGYISYLHQDQQAWDFNGHQRGHQINLKVVRDDSHGTLTFYADWQQKVEPNEDSTAFGNAQTAAARNFTPYTRPFIYPDMAACTSRLTGGPGTPPPAEGNNFSNCFSAAQREDILSYLRYEWRLAENLTWTNTVYYHYNYGRGIVAGPVNTAGLPALFATYYPNLVVGSATSTATLTNIVNLFGGSGNAVRTTEYRINRGGVLSNLEWQLGSHQIEAGVWFEHNEPAQHRVWYPMSQANNNLTPYDVPRGPKALTQYAAEFYVNDIQLYIQDQWRVLPNLLLQAGVKSSLQDANGKFPVNQRNLPTVAVPVQYPTGSIESNEWFLPQAGLLWDATENEQVFVNVQKNMRQFIPYGAGSGFYGFSAWSLGTQSAFDLFKETVDPETSWTYEAGLRTRRNLALGPVTGLDGQVTVYHVNFRDRLLNIAPYNFINPAPAILANVGGVTTDGIDVAGTLSFGEHLHLYNAVSYNKSKYDSDYQSGTTVVNGVSTPVTVATSGKQVPLTPTWMNKTILRFDMGRFEAALSGDYIGKRYVTYLNDLSVDSTFTVDLQASYRFELSDGPVKNLRLSVNVTNLTDETGVSTAAVTGNSGGYAAFPLAPRMGFITLEADF